MKDDENNTLLCNYLPPYALSLLISDLSLTTMSSFSPCPSSSVSCEKSSRSTSVDAITTSPQEPPSKKRKTKNSDEVETMTVRTLKRRRAERQVEDEEELFGHQIAATLRCLNSRQKAMTKLIFQQVLMILSFQKILLITNSIIPFNKFFLAYDKKKK